jgi:PAS domain S-box-containing protein
MDMSVEMTEATIMIIDDDPENLRVLGKMLTQQGYTVRSFPSGPPALHSAQVEPPDLILLDVRMPEMDGFEVCARLKENDALNGIPVLFISAVDETEGKVRAFELGGADYINKPFQAGEVLARIKTHLILKKASHNLEILNKDLEKLVRDRTAALQESEEKYRRIVTTANEGIVTTNDAFCITYANPVLADLLGGSVDELMGRPIGDFIFEEDREEHQRIMQAIVEEKKTTYERKIRRLDGESKWVLISASPIFDSEKRCIGSVEMATDITEQKRSEIKLREAYQEITELKNQIEADNIYLREEIKLDHNFDEIIGQSDEIKYALYRVEQVAATDSAVIIFGETGSGKELFVRAIHNAGSRADRPLIKVNCATLPEQFIESELFGHAKGAYTGADNLRQGRFEIAHRSTLFLDEIGELPLALQAKLLRVLQDGEFERLGDSHTIKTDVRLIAASNRDLEAMVKAGKFRQDLWYRLNVFPITIPPLRRRKDDIPILVKHFVKKIGKRVGKGITKISKTVLNELTAYDWPGNVRELEHILERSMILSQGKSLHLSERLTGSKGQADRAGMQPLAALERDHILRTLKQTKWVIEGPNGAAVVLEIHPNTLRYRMQKLGIRRPKHQ